MNQVRLTSSTPSVSYQQIISLLSLLSFVFVSVEMRFAHLKPHDVRFRSHHMASFFMSIGLSVHHIYHMFVSFSRSRKPRVHWLFEA